MFADNKKSSISKRSTCYLLNLKQPDKAAKRLKLSFQRTSATVLVLKADRSIDASVGFLDVSETGAGVFTPELLHKGSIVELCITEPVMVKVRGIVAWSAPVQSGIHGGKFKCRSGIQFIFDGDAQLGAVKEFVKRAHSDPVETLRTSSVTPAILPPGNNTDTVIETPVPVPMPVDATAPVVTPVVEATVTPITEAKPETAPAAEAAAVPPASSDSDGGQKAA